jgi:hypothetical protein
MLAHLEFSESRFHFIAGARAPAFYWLSESGIDRPWGTPQTFDITNSTGAEAVALVGAHAVSADHDGHYYTENELNTADGGGAVIQGLVLIAGENTDVTLQHLRVENGCVPDALRTTGGAELAGDHLEEVRSATLPCPVAADAIFVDGFESGDTSAW